MTTGRSRAPEPKPLTALHKARFARDGCAAGSPDACTWLVKEAKPLSSASAAEFRRRAVKLCASHGDTGHESVCDDVEPARAKLKVLEWRRRVLQSLRA